MGEVKHFPISVPLVNLPEGVSLEQVEAMQRSMVDPEVRNIAKWLVDAELVDHPVGNDYAKYVKHEVMQLTWGVNPAYCDVAFQACLDFYQRGRQRRAHQA